MPAVLVMILLSLLTGFLLRFRRRLVLFGFLVGFAVMGVFLVPFDFSGLRVIASRSGKCCRKAAGWRRSQFERLQSQLTRPQAIRAIGLAVFLLHRQRFRQSTPPRSRHFRDSQIVRAHGGCPRAAQRFWPGSSSLRTNGRSPIVAVGSTLAANHWPPCCSKDRSRTSRHRPPDFGRIEICSRRRSR